MAENISHEPRNHELIPEIVESLDNVELNTESSELYQPPDNFLPEPLDPISSSAVALSAEQGPLSEEQLINLLRQRFDRRSRRTTDLIQRYTQADISAVVIQLTALKASIAQMKINEKMSNDVVKSRIKKMIKDLKKKGTLPRLIPEGMSFTNTVMEAIRVIGTGEGPLTKEVLWNCIRIGRDALQNTETDNKQLEKQLDDLIIKIDEIDNVNKFHLDFACQQNEKILTDVIDELSH